MDIFNYIPLIAVIIAVCASLYASFTDLKRGIIPNKLTFPLIGVGLILNLIYAILLGYWIIFISAAIITGVIFVLGYLFWRMGAWAGGDVKLFTALAALLAIYPPVVNYSILNYSMPVYATYPFPFTVIINSILSMLPFLLIYVLYIAVRSKKHLLGELASPFKDYRKNIVTTVVVTSAAFITLHITALLPFQILVVSIILIFVLSFAINKLPLPVKAVVVIIFTVLSLWQNYQVTILGIISVFIVITLVEVIRKLLTKVSKEALQDDYKVEELKEGMIPVYNLYQRGDEVYYDDKSFYQKIVEAVAKGDISIISGPRGKLLVGTLAAGLKDEDIELLGNLSQEGKIPDTFKVKKGVPFAPSILIGLAISLVVGDLAIIFLNVLNWLLY